MSNFDIKYYDEDNSYSFVLHKIQITGLFSWYVNRRINEKIGFVLIAGELDVDDTDVIYAAKKQLATLCSCFAQLSHKALTVFQINAKTEVCYLL